MNVHTDATDRTSSKTALSVRKDASVMSVASAVRSTPPRSSDARGVTATVSSHRPAANGRKTADSVSTRMIASLPAQLSAEVVHEIRCKSGVPAMTSVASSIAAADITAKRRRPSTSTGNSEAPITAAGSVAAAASHSQASLIAIVHRLDHDRVPLRQHSLAQPGVEAGQPTGRAGERLDDEAVEHAVEKAAFEREQEQMSAHALGDHPLENAAARRWPIADRVLDAVQIVQDVRCAEELQQSEAGMASEVNERDCVPAERDLDDDDADLRSEE